MKPTVYIETSFFGYLTGRPSTDLLVAARQAITNTWWETHRARFAIYVSAAVREEALRGDQDAARRRRAVIEPVPFLIITPDVRSLASAILSSGLLPISASEDALHIAVASVHGVDYLLTWNFKHINNAEMKSKLSSVVSGHGYECPVMCSPEELIGA